MFVFANMETGKKLLVEHKPEQAAEAFRKAMLYPENLGTGQPAQTELAEQLYWLGVTLASQARLLKRQPRGRPPLQPAEDTPTHLQHKPIANSAKAYWPRRYLDCA